MPRKHIYPSFGSISSGTMRTGDLLDAFAPYCKEYGGKEGRRLFRAVYKLPSWDNMTPKQVEEAESILEEMFDLLNDAAPPYGYFGAHPGDGADYGFWLSESFEQDILDNGGVKLNAGDDIPKEHFGEVLFVTDHGNCTFGYQSRNHRFVEVWSVV
jgi:hypothetical protein